MGSRNGWVAFRAATLAVAASITVLAAVGASAEARGRCGDHRWCNTRLSPNTRAGLLLKALTRDEKISLLAGDDLTLGFGPGAEGHTGTSEGVERVDLPPTFYNDGPAGARQAGGKATAMPAPLGLAAAFSPRWARRYGAVVGNEIKLKGNDVVFAPTVNIMRTPLGGRTFEGYGEDPFLVSRTAVGWIRGAQSEGVIANLKHFAANNQEGQGVTPPGLPGAPQLGVGLFGNRFTVNAAVDERTLREIYLPAFEAAIKEANVGSVMCAYNRLNGQWACENQQLLNEILKREWGFKGYVLTDYGAARNSANSLNNGLDFEPWPGLVYSPPLVNVALSASQASPADVDGHVHRILRTMFAYGFFDRRAHPNNDDLIDKRRHARLAGKVEEQVITLLKNDRILPLRARVKSIALIGETADTFRTGGGSSQIEPFFFTTPREAIERRAGRRVDVRYDPGDNADRAAELARAADVAIVFASDASTEGADKECLDIDCGQSGDQDALIERVTEANPKTVVVLETGGPVLTPWRGKVKALLEAWYPGSSGGRAIARVLFGDADPGGRLPVSFPRREEDLPTTGGDPEVYPGVTETVRYKEGVLVGYRWLDARRIKPAFPFGHGLSYTSFRFHGLRLRAVEGAQGARGGGSALAKASVAVTNTGRRAGFAVPELYVGLPEPGDEGVQPPRQLKGFEKLRVRPGETKRVSFPLARRDLSYYDVDSERWRVARGCYGVMVGSSSRRLPLRGHFAKSASCGKQAVRIR